LRGARYSETESQLVGFGEVAILFPRLGERVHCGTKRLRWRELRLRLLFLRMKGNAGGAQNKTPEDNREVPLMVDGRPHGD
jgi:hypothetical protein